MNIMSDQSTKSTNNNVVGERCQVDEVRFALLTAQLRTSNLPLGSPFADETRIVLTGGDDDNRK